MLCDVEENSADVAVEMSGSSRERERKKKEPRWYAALFLAFLASQVIQRKPAYRSGP